MADTNVNPTTAQPIQRRPKLRDALATGTIEVVGASCKGLNALAGIAMGVSTRVTLHNTAVFLDMVEDANGDQAKVVGAVNMVLQIGKSI
jgi:hypothetical protein